MADQANIDSKEIDDKFGENRMKLFNLRCRDILNDNPQRPPKTTSSQLNQSTSQDDVMEDVAYDGDAIDIVTAYRQLKLDMQKNIKGLNQGRELINGKGYLKQTMSSAQQKFRDAPKVPENVRMGLNNDALPQIRGHTAPNGVAGRNCNTKNTRSQQCSRVASRLPPRGPAAESLNKLKGLSLMDYSFGGGMPS